VFIGVNGVGKSTSLAKTAYYLKTKGNLRVMMAGCDNFRSGAIEQLQTHASCLDLPLYQKGYKDDPAIIAKEALQEAKSKKYDVVLIDTAGRMQGNEALMRALAKLVHVNKPDTVLFVGEALVGNDSIDQLTKFNQSLIDFAVQDQNPRVIDGIIMTKFDTVDEKVGTALNMVYTTGKPIVFVGVGQKYPHLRKLNVQTVVSALMS
jgi:signal recognition particle receptor subunit alpha